jgi:NAD(P)-dependent dehydrogenase (short-subunit alcohol dehydrogenase family)
MFDFTGKTVLVTGASGVLGTALSVRLAQAGANTVTAAEPAPTGSPPHSTARRSECDSTSRASPTGPPRSTRPRRGSGRWTS